MESLVSNVASTEAIISNDLEESVINFSRLQTDTRYLDNSFQDLTPLEPVGILGFLFPTSGNFSPF